MSHDEGSSDTKKSPLHDTVPGVPDIELGRTLPTAAYNHAYRSSDTESNRAAPRPPTPSSTMPNTPASLPKHDAAAAAAQRSGPTESEGSRSSAPPVGTGGPLTFGTTRRDFGGDAPKLSAREKAKRNVLTHTLQMPLVVAPPAPPPTASAPPELRRMTLKGSAAPAAPAGWTSMHRVGSGGPPEPTSARPAPRSTVPLQNPRFDRADPSAPQQRPDASERFRRAEPSEPFQPVGRAAESNPSANRGSEPAPERAQGQDSRYAWQYPPPPGSERHRWRSEYNRDTLPGASSAVRVPSLSTKEWLFIGLLAIASAATLYSLLIDDVTSPIEEDVGAATGVAPEHVVTPAPLPVRGDRNEPARPMSPTSPTSANGVTSPQPGAAAATAGEVTEIVSEPAHAEIVLGGAVIGNTPARVVRGDKDADYLLRKPGYEPQLVRVSPHSPRSITITLHAKQF